MRILTIAFPLAAATLLTISADVLAESPPQTTHAVQGAPQPVGFSPTAQHDGEHQESDAHASHDAHVHDHHLAVFAGATSALSDGHDPVPTIGADLERRLNLWGRRIGLGALVDVAIGEEKELLFAPFVALHPVLGLRAFVAPGLLLAKNLDEKEFLFRVGTGYDFEVGSYSIGPVIEADFVEGHTALVYGLSIGRGF